MDKKQAGRPPKPIDWTQFEQLCALQCTQSEIASFLKVHPETLSNRAADQYGEDYSTIYKKYSESGKCSLRRNQFVLSKKNAAMAIWLGKQWLGQKDISKEEIHDVAEDLKKAIRDIENDRIREISRSPLETQQPLLDQRFTRQENQVPNELGAEGAI